MYLRLKILATIILISCSHGADAQNMSEELFKNPPPQYKPKTWMHAMSGNMSKEGLTKDLEAMAEAGIGGLLLFNITQGIPNGPVIYNSPEHHTMLKHAAQEAERLGLSYGVHNCDGWSSSGGPWIKPEQSMKMVVWREQVVKGGKKIIVQLPQPTTREGFYQDIAVLAYPSLASDIVDFEAKPTVTASDKNTKTALLNDHKWDAETTVKKSGAEDPWVQFDYGKSHTIRSIYMIHNERSVNFSLAVSEDGLNFTTASKLKKVRTGKGEWAINVSFEPLTARYFRVIGDAQMTIKEIMLRGTQAIDNPLGRTAIARTEAADFDPIGNPLSIMIVDKNTVMDVTKGLNTEGVLQTDLPDGMWTIMRFGYTSTSASNNPASVEGKGLEVDKLNRHAFKIHYNAFVKKVIDHSQPVASNALQYVEIDSYEMGGQNWTNDFEKIFKKRYGYDFRLFLPLLTGRFMESAAASEAVLDDYRGLICDLMTENYFQYFQELCHKDGLKTYIEPYGFGPLNDLDVGKAADMPMGEFWMNRPITQVASAVSAAHIYGRPVISAESFTAEQEINWKGHPAVAKISGDKAWALGINEFMFHRFAHQANTHVEPGMTMNRWGSHFDRTQTWWKNAGAAWFKYIARGSYLLRQGVSVSDLLIFVGDASPNSTFGRNDFKPSIPKGTNFDCVNADVLLNRLTTQNGVLILPEGTTYKALVLKNCKKIKLTTLQRLHELAQKGVPIIGEKPQILLGYHSSEADMAMFNRLVSDIWNKPSTESHFKWNEIFEKHSIKQDFEIEGREDIEFMHRKIGGTDIYFLYNPDSVAHTFNTRFRIDDKIPELWNPLDGSVEKMGIFTQKDGFTEGGIFLNAEASVFVVFKESSKNIRHVVPEKTLEKKSDIIFNLNENNKIEALISKNGTYKATLSNGIKWQMNVKDIPKPIDVTGAWQVHFPLKMGFGGDFTFNTLSDWKDHANDGIRHYAGTATYKKTIVLSKDHKKARFRTMLDLGMVKIAAHVKINGKSLGVLWMPPFIIDVTDALVAGKNTFEIEVTNQWSNKLIGDERYPTHDGGYKFGSESTNKMPAWYVNNEPLPEGQRTTFTTANFYKATDKLLPSGLLGPIVLRFSKVLE